MYSLTPGYSQNGLSLLNQPTPCTLTVWIVLKIDNPMFQIQRNWGHHPRNCHHGPTLPQPRLDQRSILASATERHDEEAAAVCTVHHSYEESLAFLHVTSRYMLVSCVQYPSTCAHKSHDSSAKMFFSLYSNMFSSEGTVLGGKRTVVVEMLPQQIEGLYWLSELFCCLTGIED